MKQNISKDPSAKDSIRKAWNEGDIEKLLLEGCRSFGDWIQNVSKRPISFSMFLEHTGMYFDRLILAAEKKNNLRFISGKITLLLDESNTEQIQMTADFYYQDAAKKWILQQKKGSIPADRFYDAETSPELQQLRQTGHLEFMIDPPEVKEG